MSDQAKAKCGACEKLVNKKDYIDEGGVCLDCFVSGNTSEVSNKQDPTPVQKPNSQSPEEGKEVKGSVNTGPRQTTCLVCKKQLDPSEVLEGSEGYCMECFIANESRISKSAKDDKQANPLTDSNFANYLIFNLFKDEEASATESYYYSNYLHIDKQDPTKVEVLPLYSSQTINPAIIASAFSSVVALSPYQYLVTGGCVIGDASNKVVPSSACLAVVLRKHDQYFNFIPFQNLLSSRYAHASVILDDFLYVLGGLQKTTKDNTYCWLNRCEKLNLTGLKGYLDIITSGHPSDLPPYSWEEVEKMNKPRANLSAFGHDNKIYAFGGFSGPNVLESSIERYDVTQKKWEVIKLKDKQQEIDYKFLASSLILRLESKIYILGGSDGQTESKDAAEVDVETLQLRTLKPLNQARASAQGFAVQKTLYIFGGQNSPLTLETLNLQEEAKGFTSHSPPEDVDEGSGLLGRGFIGDFGFYIQ